MKKIVCSLVMIVALSISLCACSQKQDIPQQDLENMTTLSGDEYTAIVWDENTYVPYCAISKSGCGKQIGIVDGDKDDRIYEYNGYSTDEWIISMYVSGLMDAPMLYREINVTDIPEGLQSEYEWNK